MTYSFCLDLLVRNRLEKGRWWEPRIYAGELGFQAERLA
jgi:hypothetical protein